MARFFQTSPHSFAEYDFKSFIWQYDKMIDWKKQEDKDPNTIEMNNRF